MSDGTPASRVGARLPQADPALERDARIQARDVEVGARAGLVKAAGEIHRQRLGRGLSARRARRRYWRAASAAAAAARAARQPAPRNTLILP